jgi:hypothetical protein
VDVWEVKDLLVNSRTPLQEWLPCKVESSSEADIMSSRLGGNYLPVERDKTSRTNPYPAETVQFIRATTIKRQNISLPWGDESAYQGYQRYNYVSEFNRIANSRDLDRDKKAVAIFTLFAEGARWGEFVSGISRNFIDLTWLRDADLAPIHDVEGKLPIDWNTNSTIFCLDLFPKTNAPKWIIYFELTNPSNGRLLSRKDAVHLLQGTLQDCKTEEFALCHSTNQTDQYIEVFSPKGIRCFGHPPVSKKIESEK